MTENLSILGIKKKGIKCFSLTEDILEREIQKYSNLLICSKDYTDEILYNCSGISLNEFLIFAKRIPPPELTARHDGPPIGLLIPSQLFEQIDWQQICKKNYNELFFYLVDLAIVSNPPTRIRAIQIPNKLQKYADIERKYNTFSVDIIVPHYGKENLLQCSLRHIENCKKDNFNIFIGLDSYTPKCLLETQLLQLPKHHFYGFIGELYGPYYIDQYLIRQGNGEIIFFQDSDDISCSNRFSMIANTFSSTKAEYIGSHEIRLDEINKCVSLFRFPLDVNKAFVGKPGHALLHPTSAILRRKYEEVGGFSTDRRFGLDYEFLLRAYFTTKIKNVDEFLYIRRRRMNSLTTADATGLDSSIRLHLTILMKDSFMKIKSGELKIENSDIRLRISSNSVQICYL